MTASASRPPMGPPRCAFDFDALSLDGQPVRLSTWQSRVLLIVNTASECGFTPQYAALQALWQRHGPDGLVVLGFPCNQFGGQEPGDAARIGEFCTQRFGVSFPMMARVDVRGAQAHPLYRWLCAQAPGLLGTRAIKWNFTKFLVGRDGRVIGRFAPTATPARLTGAIEAALAEAGRGTIPP
ncbi:glutathione peroxidase [Sphaerotilus hippei]|uniref:Glutathione peroxidase n=1 Tax=Sphaerotilus hippei TaxID=744406 RepID=A0A318GY82_9BURK|nr:glutathione peroxidase [Sphaerotilus hippei]PXW94698.1 glutathione peroxidase [Sphaerotilus hippei]